MSEIEIDERAVGQTPKPLLTPASELEARLGRFQAQLQESVLDAALIVQNADLLYFAGTVQRSYLFVPAEGEATLFVRKVYDRARAESALSAVVALPAIRELPDLIAQRYGVLRGRVGLELDVLPVNELRRLENLFPGVEFVDVARAIVAQRAVKSSWEIDRIRVAAGLADEVWRRIPGLLREGLTEAEFAGLVEAEARALGHQGVIRMRAFNQEMFYGQLLSGASGEVASYLDTPLAGAGFGPAVAQGVSFKRIARGEPVVFDFVPVVDGYTADFTRIFSVGPLPGELVRAFDVALAAQAEVKRVARPGVTCRMMWEAAAAVAAAAGLRDNFMGCGVGQVQFVGHGVGIELDEPPVLAANDRRLVQGMVFALEPKFVMPGLGAVGIENTFVVEHDGIVALTTAPDIIYEVQ